MIAVDLRRGLRFPTCFGGMVEWPARKILIAVRNMSVGGALVKGASLPSAGSRVTFVVAGLRVGARIVWRNADTAGLSFDAPVEPLAVVRDNLPEFRRKRQSHGDNTLPPAVLSRSEEAAFATLWSAVTPFASTRHAVGMTNNSGRSSAMMRQLSGGRGQTGSIAATGHG